MRAMASDMRSASRSFPSGVHVCKKRWHLKITSAGWLGNFFSIVILLRVVQIAQSSAPTQRQAILLLVPLVVLRMAIKSFPEAGFQFEWKASLTALHANLAR